jgi:hypothetical protein
LKAVPRVCGEVRNRLARVRAGEGSASACMRVLFGKLPRSARAISALETFSRGPSP